MIIFPLAPDQTIAQVWSNGARGGILCDKRTYKEKLHKSTKNVKKHSNKIEEL